MNNKKTFTAHQIGALITMVIMAVWGICITWLHMTRPLGFDYLEIVFLSAMLPIYLILLPFYALRVRWSYICGIIALLGLFAGLIKSVTPNILFFSPSVYNLTTIVVFISAGAGIYFSLRSYLELPSIGWMKSTIGIGILLLVSALAVRLVSTNRMATENFVLKQIIHGVQTRTSEIDQLDQKIEALMNEGDISSLAAAIVVNDEIVWIRGYGEGDTLDQMHDIGSTTKTIVATAVLQLYEQGLVDLDDDINQYLPISVRHPEYPDVPITIRMLLLNRSCLSHKVGVYETYVTGPSLRQWGVEKRGWNTKTEFDSLSYPEFMAGYLDPDGPYYHPSTWTNCRPGSENVYSTPGFDLLGYLVEQVSGQPLNDYLHENIFTPLEMPNTTTTPLDHPELIAVPSERFYGVLSKTNVVLPLSQRRVIGGGGLYSTTGDLANFLLAHMNQGSFGDFQLLQPETIAMMHTPIPAPIGDFMQIGYGFGWGVYQKGPRQLWDITFQPRGYQGHGGSWYGYYSSMFMVEEEYGAYGVVVLINTGNVGKFDFPWAITTRLNIRNLLLNEAYQMYQDSLNE